MEVVDPVLLGSKIMEKASDCNCCCCCNGDVPASMMNRFEAPPCFDDDAQRFLTVSLGIFSVVRTVRPAQLLIQASEYAIPEKECVTVEEDDPCHVFRTMPFPSNEFTCSASHCHHEHHDRPDRGGHCGC